MHNRVFDKGKLPSRDVREGTSRDPHGFYFCAMGLTHEQIHQPCVGVASCRSEAAPCNIALMRQAQAVKQGVVSAGGIPLLRETLVDHGFLHGDCLTVTGRTVNDNLRKVVWNTDQDVIWPADKPITATGGVVGLPGSLAPEGAMVKVAGMPEAGLTFQAPALCFDNEEDCFEAVTKRRYAEGCVGHGGSEAAVGGPIARVRDGDIIQIDAINDRIDLLVEDLELEKRKKDWQLRKTNFGSGALWKYAQSVGPAATVAVTHRGASSEATVYADV